MMYVCSYMLLLAVYVYCRFKVNERELNSKEGTWKGDISVLVGTRRETTNMSYVANLPQRELG